MEQAQCVHPLPTPTSPISFLPSLSELVFFPPILDMYSKLFS